MIKTENLSFSFGRSTKILESVSFSLEAGDYLSIIGPNGAGKSTLLKCLLRLHEQGKMTGDIFFKGRSINDYSQKELARLVSYVPQAGGWIPPFTVRELLRLSRFPYADTTSGLNSRDYQAIDRALDVTDLGDMADRYLKTLSGGQRQKAYLAAAVAQETEIMLLDEPASFLDPKHCAELNAMLGRLNRDHGLTMLVVTHDLNHPLSLGGQILVLKNGRKIYFGPQSGLLDGQVLEEAYQHHFLFMTHPTTGRPVVLAE